MTVSPSASAATFRRLHHHGLLVLPNAWDAGSARLIAQRGAKAIATSSAAVAWSHGYADGDLLPVSLLVATVEGIVRSVDVPVSVDVEGGYATDPVAVANTVARVIDAGGVGINIEDGTADPALLCAKIEAIKRAAAKENADLFVNARTDVYLQGLAPAERRVDETLARAERYRGAGADGIFVPGVVDADEIRRIASAVRMPLNVLARKGLPSATELEAIGVRRLSAGSGLAQAMFGRIAALTDAFLKTGASDPLAEGAMVYGDINALMAASASS
jgi:2-methylisocitrate lyase-like PEP mutase family enzyme